MQFVAPDILAEARDLSTAMLGSLAALGVALWLFGWRWHRFWVVAGITLAAGLIGLNAARPAGVQVIAVGILLAVAAGMMALELAKVVAFVAGGLGAWLAVQWVLPQAQELWAAFLSGGLLGLMLYRVWTMLLTSLMGTLLTMHAAILLLAPAFSFDPVLWAGANNAALNGVAVGIVILGILLQVVAAPEEELHEVKHDEGKKDKKDDTHFELDEHGEHHEKAGPWWKKLLPARKAA